MLSEYALWLNAPDWAMYAAQDSDGTWHWYEKKPHARLDEGIWYCIGKQQPCAFERPLWARSAKERPLIRTPLEA